MWLEGRGRSVTLAAFTLLLCVGLLVVLAMRFGVLPVRVSDLWPLDLAVCRTSTRLDFRSDPADELIAATSVVHKVPLLTRDARLRKSKVVPLA